MSQFSVGTETKPHHFLIRNHVVAKLADAVVVVEASDHSGALHTASYAISQGVQVFAVPGDITRPMSAGCNNILKEAACSYTGFEEFLKDAFGMSAKVSTIRHLSPQEQSIVAQIRDGVIFGEQIAQNINMDIAIFRKYITLLEIKGVVNAHGCNQWTLA